MTNMFSGHIKKEIPKNVDDCIKPDSVSTNLWAWCELLEKWGKILFWILIVGGLLFAIDGSLVEKEVVVREATLWGKAETELRTVFDIELFIPLLLNTALYAFLEYSAYHIIALLIGALASIVQNTKISANVAIYNIACNSIDETINSNDNVDNAQNNTCEKEENKNQINQSIVDFDACPNSSNVVEIDESDVIKPYETTLKKSNNNTINHQWRCSCGKMISTKTCPHCGIKYE